ncbi:K02A2.6-like [Cordylochernes scorpioides]|uniref:K02A2.6-like n=1 Tax=Cordylochernes scorpioides TaxID=51811 RepID=A0ABY6LCQ5_9ARAC|nr:K02A2.6-like [Cordylochernes scorpioides]
MENMLGNFRWQICLGYLDDVIIYSSDFSTHLKRIEAVLRCFREANLKLNNKKCQFAFEELEILGHITSQHGIKPAEHNIKAIRDFPRPKKIKEVQSFYECAHLIENYRSSIDKSPNLSGHFDPNATTYIHTNASNISLGATLVQKFGDKEKVILYLSRTFRKPEQNYSTTEKECLAVVWSMSKLRPYLYGRHFKILTSLLKESELTLLALAINEKKKEMDNCYAETKVVSEAAVKEVSTLLIEHIILRHGALGFLISDIGTQFSSNLMKEFIEMCKVKHCFTTSYHPQTNGLTERLNRTLINMISMYVNTDQKKWDEILFFITHVYNITIQETTGYSPFFLLFGSEPMSLSDDENIPTNSNMDDYDEYIENYSDKIARTRQRIYEPGHLVAVWTPVRKIGKCEKLLRKIFGPYRILKKLPNVNYLIEPKDNPGQDPLIVHVSRLKPYYERSVASI